MRLECQGFLFFGASSYVVPALTLGRLPRFLVIEPVATVRFELTLTRPACEIDVELENPGPGRSFLLLIGPQGGPLVQRMRLTGRARVVFEPRDRRTHVLMLANPQKEPLVLRLKGRSLRSTAPELSAQGRARRRTARRAHAKPRPRRTPRAAAGTLPALHRTPSRAR